jgi:protoporphyrinogen oxidase
VITRRDFLNGMLVGAAGLSAGPLLHGIACGADGTGKPPARERGDAYDICHALAQGEKNWRVPGASGELYDSIIIGGGISGLVAAWQLSKLKHRNILLLEKNDSVGGYCRDERSGRQIYSIASAYTAYPDNRTLVDLYSDLGMMAAPGADRKPVVADRYLPSSTESKDYIDGAWYDDAWDSGIDDLPLSKKVRGDLGAFRDNLQYWYRYVGADGKPAFGKSTDESTTDAKARNLDTLTLKEYVLREGWDVKASEFFDSFVRSSMGSTHDRISAWAAISFLLYEFDFRTADQAQEESARQGTNVLTQPGGNGYLSRLLADRIGPERIRTSAFVLQAKNAGDEVHVTYLDGENARTARARTAIYAAPRYVAPYLLPDLPAAAREGVKAFQYAPYIVANVHVSKTPGPPMWNGLVHGDSFITDFVVADWPGLSEPHHAPMARPNVLTVYAPLVMPGQRQRLLTLSADCYEEWILADLDRVLPGVRSTVTGFDLYRWGHAVLAADKGFVFSKARRSAARPVGRLFFANHDVEGVPAFESAVMSAVRAAREADRTIRGAG